MEPGRGLEPRCYPYQGYGSPSILARHQTYWSRVADLNGPIWCTKPGHRRLCLRGWSRSPDSSRAFSITSRARRRLRLIGERTGVLTVRRLPLERKAPGVEPGFPAAWSGPPATIRQPRRWQRRALPIELRPQTYGAESDSPTRLTGSEDQNLKRSANPAKIHLSCCQRAMHRYGRDGWIRTSVTLLPKQVR